MTSRPLKRALAAAAIAAALALAAAGARSQQLVADLSSHLIAITTGFTGTDVVLFGAVDGPGDVAVVVQGPEDEVVVRRKERIAGIWVNTRSMVFDRVPAYYAAATTRPFSEMADDSVLARHEIGLPFLELEPESPAPPETVADFRRALIRNKKQAGLYASEPGSVLFLGERLFRTTIHFPANVPTGAYIVGVYLVRDGDVVSAQTTPLAVSKIGFSAEVYELAVNNSVLYGGMALVVAIAAGWLAGTIFRKV